MAQAVAHPKQPNLDELRRLLQESPVVALAGVDGIPAPQMQRIRQKLRGKVAFRVVKNRLLLRALEEVARERKGIEQLEPLVQGPTALVTAEGNPFHLFKELEATKTRAPARGGEVAPDDIAVKEGDTPFKPGPVVGDLQKAGVPAAIERGKVVIKRDKVLVEKGKRIPRDVAKVLTRLEIYPLTVGLDLRGVYEDGAVFPRDVLAVDEEALRGQLLVAATRSFALALEIAYPAKETIVPLLRRAHQGALALAVAGGVPEKAALPLLLARARGTMLRLAARAPEALDEELKALLGSRPAVAVPEPEAKPAERKRAKDEEGDEEEAAAGLGSLFG